MITVAENPKNECKIVSMTKGEMGTYNKELKGEKLGKIREQELRRAAKIEGISQVEFLGQIDAHTKINQETIDSARAIIESFTPDVVFAPECLYYYYVHRDHVNTGLIVYHLIKKLKPPNRPKLFTYNSYVNTHYFPMKHWRRQSKALLVHKSQYWLLLPAYPLRFILGLYFGFCLPRRYRRFLMAEAYRKVDFQADSTNKLGLKQRIFGRIAAKLKSIVKPMV